MLKQHFLCLFPLSRNNVEVHTKERFRKTIRENMSLLFRQDIAHLMFLWFKYLLVNSTHCSKSHFLWMFSDLFESSAMSDQDIESHLIGGWKSCGLTQRQRHHDDRPPRSSDRGHLCDQCIAKADTLLSESAQPVRGLKVFPTAPHLCKVACPI